METNGGRPEGGPHGSAPPRDADGAEPRKQTGRRRANGRKPGGGFHARRFAAIDLGTNNCRLLVAAPQRDGYRIVDAFSRIVRLGEGVSQTGNLSEAAMVRAIAALKICADKIERRGVGRGRYIATQACRGAANGAAFIDRVAAETGLNLEIISTEEEARLAVRGCAPLIDPEADAALIFDIGGGSTEISWLDLRGDAPADLASRVTGWTSLPFGVVNLAERTDAGELDRAGYQRLVDEVADHVGAFGDAGGLRPLFEAGRAHLLGTSGTVTSIAGVHLGLPKYIRGEVDGLWLSLEEAQAVSERLRAMGLAARAAEPCIGADRADLVVGGCAILEGVAKVWPSARLRVADRGLREGLLAGLMAPRSKRKRRRRRKRPGSGAGPGASA